jgi:hypothetical protein
LIDRGGLVEGSFMQDAERRNVGQRSTHGKVATRHRADVGAIEIHRTDPFVAIHHSLPCPVISQCPWR